MRNEERATLRASATAAEEVEENAILGLPETEEKEFKFKSIFNRLLNFINFISKFFLLIYVAVIFFLSNFNSVSS